MSQFENPHCGESGYERPQETRPVMRDIRNDLRERLAAIASRYAEASHLYADEIEALEAKRDGELADLARERAAAEQMLAFEERRAATMPGEPIQTPTAKLVPLADFLVTKAHTAGPLGKDDLRQEAGAAGYFADGDGRTFHTTLLNVVRHGKVRKLADGRYTSPLPQGNTLFGMGDQPQEAQAVN